MPEGTKITLWYSTGLGNTYITIPDVTGMTVAEAQETLLRRKLRAVVIGREEDFDGLGEPTVKRQSRDPGTRVREGFELRKIRASLLCLTRSQDRKNVSQRCGGA